MHQERYFIVEVVTPGIDAKEQYRISVFNGETMLLSALYPDQEERDRECKWWEGFGYVRRFRAKVDADRD